MSNILEALRKAQDEKSRASDQTITGRETLIAHRTTRSWAGTNKRGIWLACSGVVLLTVVGWLLYGPTKPASAPKAALTASAPAEQPQLPPQPAPVVAAAPSLATPTPPPQATATVPVPPQPNEDEEEGSPRRKNRHAANRATPTPAVVPGQAPQPPRSPEATVSSAPEGVKLTGIAWQDSRKMRRAVINDVLIGEGAVVAGAKVLEIRPGLVRFEKNGSVFEAALPR
ncbi:MAG: hypothetical protein PHN92_05440 [Geobacter sp.]|nr:hypothetical protein [Geobacter sp.]